MRRVYCTLIWLGFSALMLPGCAAAPTPGAGFTLDTPINVIAANAQGKAVLMHDLPGVMTNPKYPMFSDMSLSQLASLSSGRLTPAKLAVVQADLAKIPGP